MIIMLVYIFFNFVSFFLKFEQILSPKSFFLIKLSRFLKNFYVNAAFFFSLQFMSLDEAVQLHAWQQVHIHEDN